MQAPSTNPITLPFAATTSPYSEDSPHKGVDFGWRAGNGAQNLTLVMPCDGTVILKPNNGADGNGVYFNDPSGRYYMGLLHTSQYLVANGATVKQGTPVAIMGATGNAQGVHCHWAVIDRQKLPDPLLERYINGLTLLSGGSGGEDMHITKEQIMAISRMASFAYPGDNFNYDHFTQPEATQELLDELINTFVPYSEQKIEEYAALQNQVSAGSGSYTPYNGSPLYTKVNGK